MREQIEELKTEHQRIESLPLLAKAKPSETLIGGLLHVVDQLAEEVDQLKGERAYGRQK